MSLATEIRQQNQDPRYALYLLDGTPLGGTVFRFHNHKTAAGAAIGFGAWGSFTPFPIDADGFDRSTKGTLPTPRLKVSNIGGVLFAVLRVTGDLSGALFTRLVVKEKYTDGGSSPDDTQIVSKEVWELDHKANQDEHELEFVLRAILDVEDYMLPGRQIIADSCSSRVIYRGPDCGHTGPPITDKLGALFASLGTLTARGGYSAALTYAPLDWVYEVVAGVQVAYVQISGASHTGGALTDGTVWSRDFCLKLLSSCKLRNWPDDVLPFGGFPGCSRLPQV